MNSIMNFLEIIFISIGLAMDAFAVSICKGLSMKKMSCKKAIIIGLYFGTFQALMPIIGYFCGVRFEKEVKFIDHWIAFILLGFIGRKMIKESFDTQRGGYNGSVDFKAMLVLSIATSIDALACRNNFCFLKCKYL